MRAVAALAAACILASARLSADARADASPLRAARPHGTSAYGAHASASAGSEGVSGAVADDDAEPAYPRLYSLGEVLRNWNPDNPDPPASYAKHDTLRRLDYQKPDELQEARYLREAELPFIVYNIPGLNSVVDKWTDDYLTDKFGSTRHSAERSNDNHFMYHERAPAGAPPPARAPPTVATHMSFAEWRAHAKKMSTPGAEGSFYYMSVQSEWPDEPGRDGTARASDSPDQGASWIAADYTMFDARAGNAISGGGAPGTQESHLFVVDPHQQTRVECRFGARGIIAEAHYDSGRNFVTMARGRKRYILAPPSQCSNLHIMRTGPSMRHSAVDWSHPDAPNERWSAYHPLNVADGKFYAAQCLDTVIAAGEALYIPAFWFHYPTSLDTSIQCNSRSGYPDVGVGPITRCGFFVWASEHGRDRVRDARARHESLLNRLAQEPVPKQLEVTISATAIPYRGAVACAVVVAILGVAYLRSCRRMHR